MIPSEIREIHVDAQKISRSLLSGLYGLDFYDDHFISAGGGMERPPFHLTWEIEGSKNIINGIFKNQWREVIHLIKQSKDFVGYAEAEVITDKWRLCFPHRKFQTNNTNTPQLPKLILEPSLRNKVADLHIKIPKILLHPKLEESMNELGVFYVDTPKENRIYTMQFYSHNDGKQAFRFITEYFKVVGAATEITYEIVPWFYRQPLNLPVPASVLAGSLSE